MDRLIEFTHFEGQADANVFKDIKVLGLKSRNGYSYTPDAVAKAAPLYEGIGVFVDHRKGDRSYADRVGFIKNVHVKEKELYADFVLNEGHTLAKQILFDAQHNSTGVGFSHEAHGDKRNGIVSTINKVDRVCPC